MQNGSDCVFILPFYFVLPICILFHFYFVFVFSFSGLSILCFVFCIRPRGLVLSASNLGRFVFLAHFVSCLRVWDKGVKVAGSGPAGGILAQMCECVIALRVTHLHIRQQVISICGDRTWVDARKNRKLNNLEKNSQSERPIFSQLLRISR